MTPWRKVRDAFWFLPAVLGVLAVMLAEAMIALDERVDASSLGPFAGLVNQVGEAGSRDVLVAIASSMLTVAATGFSITIAVLATASATYGPRLVRNFMADRGNQLVLGVFTATFLYSLMVLRSIRSRSPAEEAFVPHLAVNLAVLLAVLAVAILIYFIHHIADSVQVWTLATRVRTELLDTVERVYPRNPEERLSTEEDPGEVAQRAAADGTRVFSDGIGYVQDIAEARLVSEAAQRDIVIALRVRPGDHLIEHTPVADVWPPERVDGAVADLVRSCLVTGHARTPQQDIGFAVRVLEEMAVRALSPSTNDPYTALNALDDLGAGLVRLAGRTMPSPFVHDEAGRLRLVSRHVDLEDLVDGVFDAMRTYAVNHATVLRRTLELARQIGEASVSPSTRTTLDRHVHLVVEAYARSGPQASDLLELQQLAGEVQASLAAVGRRGAD